MSPTLEILALSPGASVQDLGRPGFLALGLAQGGAADRRALWEAAALLCQAMPGACLELPHSGGRFRVTAPMRIALTGAPMRAARDGQPLLWNAAHRLHPGEELTIGPAEAGIYGYLSFAGGITTEPVLGARAAHAPAGIGTPLAPGTRLLLGPDPAPETPPCALPPDDRFTGGVLRVMPGPQTDLFEAETRARAFATAFTAGPGNRQGLALHHAGAPFTAPAAAGLVSDLITPGDVQMTGAGLPVVLLSECQTVGGYPRLGTVIPADLPRAAQAAPGVTLRLRAITLSEAEAASPPETDWLAPLARACRPLIRDPHDIADLLGYQLISGAVRGDEETR